MAQVKEIMMANTSNVKEMEFGRVYSVRVPKLLPNCSIVTLGAAGTGVNDHVYAVTADAAETAIGKHVVVAPEIVVEQYSLTDGHIGYFRLDAQEVYSAYELQLHDRIEYSEKYFTDGTLAEGETFNVAADGKFVHVPGKTGCLKVVSVRDMARGMILKPDMLGLYNGAKTKLVKLEVVK